jgi:hypothetical protein
MNLSLLLLKDVRDTRVFGGVYLRYRNIARRSYRALNENDFTARHRTEQEGVLETDLNEESIQ